MSPPSSLLDAVALGPMGMRDTLGQEVWAQALHSHQLPVAQESLSTWGLSLPVCSVEIEKVCCLEPNHIPQGEARPKDPAPSFLPAAHHPQGAGELPGLVASSLDTRVSQAQ